MATPDNLQSNFPLLGVLAQRILEQLWLDENCHVHADESQA